MKGRDTTHEYTYAIGTQQHALCMNSVKEKSSTLTHFLKALDHLDGVFVSQYERWEVTSWLFFGLLVGHTA